jgi:hypothetical protein
MVNKELAQSGDQDRSKAIQKEISAVETKIANVRKAIEDGLGDAAWANQRLVELQGQLQELENSKPKKSLPRFEAEDVRRYIQNLARVLEHASTRERKELLRLVVQEIKLTPEELSVEIVHQAPGPNFMFNMVAGALFEATHKVLGKSLRRLIHLPKNGRRPSTKKYSETSSPSSRFPKNNSCSGLLVTIVDRVLVAFP